MPRVKRGVQAHNRHKKVLKKAKGYYGARSRVYRVAKQAVTKAGQYAYRDRKVKKRMFRALWIQRINAAARECGLSYSRMIDGLKKAEIETENGEVKLPQNWGGFELQPLSYEFWQGRENRLHDRLQYQRENDRWKMRRLGP